MTLTFLDMTGHLSFALTALSFYVRDILFLRGLAIVSGLVGIVYNYSLPAGSLWLVISSLSTASELLASSLSIGRSTSARRNWNCTKRSSKAFHPSSS